MMTNMKKLLTIDYTVDVASGSYGLANIQTILGIILLILSILSIIIKSVMTIYIHIKNKNYNGVIEELEKTKGDFKIDDFKKNVAIMLKALNVTLDDTPFKIAYRVQNELVLYFTELIGDSIDAKQDEILISAFDDIMMMKVLPRIEGDDELLGNRSSGALHNLKDFAVQNNLTKSIDKIEEMLKRLERSHFTSFWP